jgi:hypothetical protein
MRELIFATMLALSAAAVIFGTATYSAGAAWIVSGFLLAAGSWLVFGEVSE